MNLNSYSDPNIFNDANSGPSVRFSLIEGCIGSGSNNAGNNLDGSLDPLFVDADAGDLRLLPTSPAIDAGDNDADLDGFGSGSLTISDVISDLNGNPRIVAVRVLTATVDLGAYEASNSPPAFISSPPIAATEDLTYSYAISTSDPNQPDNSGLTQSALVLPAWLGLVDNGDGSGTLSGTPTNGDVGEHAVMLQVQESLGLTATQSFTVAVANVNDPPSFTSTPVTDATQGAPYNYSITTDDPDAGDNRILTATLKPPWLTLVDHTDGTATLSGTPTNGDVGEHAVTLQVADAGGLSATQSFTISVANVNDPPSFTSTPMTDATQGVPYNYSITTDDPDVGDNRTLTAIVKPGWLVLTDNTDGTATLSGTPTNGEVGEHDITLQVEDAGGLNATQSFTVTVANVNDPPKFTSSPPLTATEGLAYTYAVSTTDPDAGDTRSLTLLVGPGWLALTDNGNGTATLSGTLSGTPGAGDVGDVGDVGDDPVTLQVQDMDGLTDTQSFTVTVSAVVSDTGGLAGQVTSEGIGVPGVTVTVNSEAAANAVRAAAVVTETVTDDAGTYFVDSLTPGDYTLTFDPPDGYDPPDPVDVTVVAGQTANVPNVSLTGNSTLLHLPVVVTQGP